LPQILLYIEKKHYFCNLLALIGVIGKNLDKQ